MKKTKTVCKSLWLLVTVILLAGCWDREEQTKGPMSSG